MNDATTTTLTRADGKTRADISAVQADSVADALFFRIVMVRLSRRKGSMSAPVLLLGPTRVLILFLFLSMLIAPAHARLGGTEDELPAESTAMGFTRQVQVKATSRYRVHSVQTAPDGLQVRQYAGPDGNIFAVVWEGPVKPDLAQLLGSYYGRYLTEAASAIQVRGLRQVNRADFALRLGGHMRHFQGSAWIPSLLPAGVDPSELR
jgi:Protein of unknown function (DUF2844)